MVGLVGVQPAFDRAGGDAQRVAAGGLLDGFEVEPVRGARPYECFDFGLDLGRETCLEAPFFAASAVSPRWGVSRASLSASLTSTNAFDNCRKR